MVAIDFTSENGDPSNPRSLHYLGAGDVYNAYESAIIATASCISNYSLNQCFELFGFGGISKQTNGQTSHAFALNQIEQSPGVYCLAGLL